MRAILGCNARIEEADDYVVDHVARQPDRPAIPDGLWEGALRVAGSDDAARSERLWLVGVAAYQEGRPLIAMSSMRVLANAGDAVAMGNVGIVLGELGRSEEAVGVFDEVVARFGDAPEPALREQVANDAAAEDGLQTESEVALGQHRLDCGPLQLLGQRQDVLHHLTMRRC